MQLTGVVGRGEDEVVVGFWLGLRGEAEAVDESERRVAAARAESLGEECMVVGGWMGVWVMDLGEYAWC